MKKIIILTTFLTTLAMASFEQATADYVSGSYIRALTAFYTLAKNDDDKAQFNVALIYENGLGVSQDLKRAKQWYEKSAKQGNAQAQFNLAKLYYALSNEDIHAYKKSKYWYEKSTELGFKYAYNNLAVFYLKGLSVKKDTQKAFELLKQGAQKGDSTAQINVALLYAWGEGVVQDKMKAYENLQKALQSGKSEASQYLDKLCKESVWVCKE